MIAMKKLGLAFLLIILGLTLSACNAKPIKDWTKQIRLAANETILQLEAGGDHVLIATSLGRVLAYGDNTSGQLGIGSKKAQKNIVDITANFGLQDGESIVQLGAGNTYSYALSNLHRLFVWGSGLLDSGSGYVSPEDVTALIPLFSAERLVSIRIDKYEGILAAVTNLDRYVQIRPVKDASPFALEIVHLITFYTLEAGETILEHAISSSNFQALTDRRLVLLSFDPVGIWTNTFYSFTNMTPSFPLQARETIVQIVNGYSITYAVTSTGRMFGWGLNDKGQLGILPDAFRLAPSEISYIFQLPTGESIASIDAFLDFGVMVTSQNRIFTWGYSLYDFSKDTPIKPAMMLPRDMTDQLGFREGETVSRYSVGRSHAYFATTDNRLLIWSIGN
jgi:alpha-tubulin suppressor-like RCC1 family protein